MSPEQITTEFLRNRPALMAYCSNEIHYGEAPDRVEEPYLIVYSITPGKNGRIKAHFPLVQISCFHSDKFKVIELAELVEEETDGYVGTMTGSTYTDDCHSQRLRPLRNDDGSWMCPVEMKFSYLEG